MNGTRQLLVKADDHLLGENTYYKQKHRNISVVVKELSLGVIMKRQNKMAGSTREEQKRRGKLNNG